MVGVVGSSPIAPTKFGREIRHLAETPGAFLLVAREKYGNSLPRRDRAKRTQFPSILCDRKRTHRQQHRPGRERQASAALFAFRLSARQVRTEGVPCIALQGSSRNCFGVVKTWS